MNINSIIKRLKDNPKQTLKEAIGWRLYSLNKARVNRLPLLFGGKNVQWLRVVMHKETEEFVENLNYKSMDALEISGSKWETFGFSSYKNVHYPEYSICDDPPIGNELFDFIVAEQVFEHLLKPYQAAKNVHEMLRPGGWCLITMPFMFRIHGAPYDCTRWTETGIKYFLAEAGFDLEKIHTGSWGNYSCVKKNLRDDVLWIPWKHSLRNDKVLPIVVWAFAQK